MYVCVVNLSEDHIIFVQYGSIFVTFRVGGSLPIVASYCAEFIDSKKRAKFLGALASFWIFGQIFSAGLAWTIIPHVPNSWYFLHSWQVFTIVAALPSLLAACIYLLLPESPKFLHQVK